MQAVPRVSVIIPAYNAEAYISNAIQSIVEQTFQSFEVIIIDDASSDTTYDIARAWNLRDTRVQVYRNKKNLGIGANRSKGIELAKGEYICWQDADDISLPNRLEQQVSFLDAHKDVGIVGGFITLFDSHGDIATRKYNKNDKELRENIFKYNPVAQPAAMCRAECYRTVGLYKADYTVSEDLEMLFRIGTKYKFGNVQEVVLKYRQLDNSLTKSNLKKMEQATLRLRKQYRHHSAYHFSIADWLFNVGQRCTVWMPLSLRMKLFTLIRGDS
ncbi:glycosyltransferase [Candidatus Saccharibacteria bacterium]|nr:glycosyltransferase [Candidatus Saccharibacteria bacterium]